MSLSKSFCILAVCLVVISNAAANDDDPMQLSPTKNAKGNPVPTSTPPLSKIPPEITEYLRGPTSNNRQFDFLIGTWDVSATRYGLDGVAIGNYRARWVGKLLDGGRMIMDDFRALSPDGHDVSSYVTLRTYSERTGRWEMAGLAALQPAVQADWFGVWREGEMHLEALGKSPTGQPVKTKIRFFSISETGFDWESTMSVDDGKSWSLTAKLNAKRER